MADTDQGDATLPAAMTPTNFDRVYLTGLGYEGGFGVAANLNAGPDAILIDMLGLAGERTDDPRPPLSKPAGTEQGVAPDKSDAATPGLDWFEHIHLLPRTKIEFGNILTPETETYELYNSYRRDAHTLLTVTNNVTPGVSLSNLSPPVLVPPQSSILDPSTTDNTGDTFALGTLVKMDVVAEQNGLPIFDDNIIFNFVAPANSPQLFLSGQRIVLIPLEYESPTSETLAFLTDVIEALDGKDYRIALRDQPRQIFEVLYRLDTNDRQRILALLMDWTDKPFGFPLWHEKLRLTASVSAAATSYPVSAADEVDLRIGGLALVLSDNNTFDVINIDALTATTITAADPSINAYAAGTPIMPLRTATILKVVPAVRYANNLEDFQITFEVIDNTTGALAGSTTPGFWEIYNGKVLFSDGNVVNGTMSEQFVRRIHRLDNLTGQVTIGSDWDKNKRLHEKGFVARSRAEIISLRRLLIALQGKVKSFYIPTFIDDLTPAAALINSTAILDVERHEYVRLIRNRDPKATFKITFTDGTSLVRTIQSSVIHPTEPSQERLTIDTNWPADRPLDEIVRLEYYEQIRFDSDHQTLVYPRIGLASMVVPVKAVFDG